MTLLTLFPAMRGLLECDLTDECWRSTTITVFARGYEDSTRSDLGSGINDNLNRKGRAGAKRSLRRFIADGHEGHLMRTASAAALPVEEHCGVGVGDVLSWRDAQIPS